MWASMADAYGSAFTSQFGATPNETWAAGLADHSLVDINLAIGRLVNAGREFTPNLASVIFEITKGAKHWGHARIEAADQAQENMQALPNPARILSPAEAKEQINKIRQECRL